MAKQSNKTIIALSDFEHIRKRPEMYIGSVVVSSEKIPIITKDGIIQDAKVISVGFYKLMNEIVDNAFDEAKRLHGKMKSITVKFDSATNRVTVTDTGEGFHRGVSKNIKTGMSNIDTAMTQLRAGSNFYNEDTEENLIGTNGVGASVVNMLSNEFTIHTVNKTHDYKKTWTRFIETDFIKDKRDINTPLGTTVSYIPDTEIFKNLEWDKEYIHTLMVFRNYLKNHDPVIKNVKFKVFWDGKELDLETKFIPNNAVIIETKLGILAFWKAFSESTSVSYINGAQCTGIHQKIYIDEINRLFDYQYAHHHYETFIMLNLPPSLVKFADQNKTRYALGRWDIEPMIKKVFWNKMHRFIPSSKIFKTIKKEIEERLLSQEMSHIKKAKKRKKAHKVSEKYFAPSAKKDKFIIVEGQSAMGGILATRDSKTEGYYALKGKIKNAKKITDLSRNEEIIDIMSILGIDPQNSKNCTYDKIVIATDQDPDGHHIASLLINLFYNWFPDVITQGRLYKLITPLISVDIKGKREYMYSSQEFQNFQSKDIPFTKLRYLKGLGSLNEDDWAFVRGQNRLIRIRADRSARKYLNIAFNSSSDNRKKWLSGK